MRLIILEGVDGVGKSTMAELYKARYNQVVSTTHWPKPPADYDLKSPFQYWMDKISAAVPYGLVSELADTIVWDRSFLGNLIYGSHKKDQAHINFVELTQLLERLGQIFDRIDICILAAPEETLRKRIKERGEDYIDELEIAKLQADYTRLFASLRVHPFKADIGLHLLMAPAESTPEQVFQILNQYVIL